MRYFEFSLKTWSKLSNIKYIAIHKIEEENIIFDIYDNKYIKLENIINISGGVKKGNCARMISSNIGYNSSIHEWRIKCIYYHHGIW